MQYTSFLCNTNARWTLFFVYLSRFKRRFLIDVDSFTRLFIDQKI